MRAVQKTASEVTSKVPGKDSVSENTSDVKDTGEVLQEMPTLTEHLQDLFERATMSDQQANEMAQLLLEFEDIFPKDDTDHGCFKTVQY